MPVFYVCFAGPIITLESLGSSGAQSKLSKRHWLRLLKQPAVWWDKASVYLWRCDLQMHLYINTAVFCALCTYARLHVCFSWISSHNLACLPLSSAVMPWLIYCNLKISESQLQPLHECLCHIACGNMQNTPLSDLCLVSSAESCLWVPFLWVPPCGLDSYIL